MYSYNEVLEASTEYFDGDDLAAKVWLDKYALKNNEGEILEKTPVDMHWRMAKEFARIQKNKYANPLTEQEIFDLFDRFTYICPQGSPMFGIGNNYTYQSLGNCFTLGSEHPYDSYAGIMYADQMLANLFKRRCGAGILLDNIRPKGLTTQNAAQTTDGIGVFMERFSNTTREVAMAGRRGALLEGISVHHPEVETFINIKKDKTKVTGANISVLLTDEFMDAVKKNKNYEQRWPVKSNNPKVKKLRPAREIWDQIIESCTASAEPGVLFIDTAKKFSTSHPYHVVDTRFADEITNPCGEIFMGMDSCRLMLINLYSYVDSPFTNKARFNYDKFSEHCRLAQRLMDDMVDLEIEKMSKILEKIDSDPEPEFVKIVERKMWQDFLDVAKKGRRTGLGITGLGDALAALGIVYGSTKSLKESEKIYKALAINSMKASCEMAKELGAFPLYDKSIEKNNVFMDRLLAEDDELKKLHNKYGRRNISLTTTAPAGSVSLLTQTSSGIEPVFMVEYMRRRKVPKDSDNISFVDALGDYWEQYTVYHHKFLEWKNITGKDSVEESPYHKGMSNDIDWKASVKLQGLCQKWITHSISKTCNLPRGTTKELMSEIYMEAYDSGCKGFTAYIDGCRDGVLVTKNDTKREVKSRPKELPCDVFHFTVKGNPYFAMVGLLEDRPYEVFAGRNGFIPSSVSRGKIEKLLKPKCYRAILEDGTIIQPITLSCNDEEEAMTRLISMGLRHNVPLNFLVDQLSKTQGELTSFSKVLARALKKYLKEGEKSTQTCPECKNKLIYAEGCVKCSCGFSKCG